MEDVGRPPPGQVGTNMSSAGFDRWSSNVTVCDMAGISNETIGENLGQQEAMLMGVG